MTITGVQNTLHITKFKSSTEKDPSRRFQEFQHCRWVISTVICQNVCNILRKYTVLRHQRENFNLKDLYFSAILCINLISNCPLIVCNLNIQHLNTTLVSLYIFPL